MLNSRHTHTVLSDICQAFFNAGGGYKWIWAHVYKQPCQLRTESWCMWFTEYCENTLRIYKLDNQLQKHTSTISCHCLVPGKDHIVPLLTPKSKENTFLSEGYLGA
jgi:hypothetical protein